MTHLHPERAGAHRQNWRQFSAEESVISRFIRSLLAMLLAMLGILPVTAHAESLNDPSFIAAEQARSAFAAHGYVVDPIINWGWPIPSLSSFVVHDVATQRVLMVLVFPSTSAAGMFRGYMAKHEETAPENPPLVAGYGPSSWNNNVAMIQSTETELVQLAQMQGDRDNGTYTAANGALDPRAVDTPVDLDFQQALRGLPINI